MIVDASPSLGRVRPSALHLAGAALLAAITASPAFAGCGSTGITSGTHPPSTLTGVQVGASAPSGSTGSGGSSCATGISNTTKLGNTVRLGTSSAGAPTHTHVVHQNFKFHGTAPQYMGPHKHNP